MNLPAATLRQYLNFDKRFIFISLCIYYVLFSYLWQEFLFTDSVYYNTFGEQVSLERIEAYINIQRSLKWIGFAILPLIILIKTSLVAVCLNIGTIFAGYRTQFGKLFKITLLAESVFVAASFVRVLWLYFVVKPETIVQIKMFYPLSLLSLYKDRVEGWLVYPLQTLNLFELAYWLVLALGLKWLLNQRYEKALLLVMASYGVGLLVWAVFITFLSVNMS
jgi:hypothetical protein